MGTVLAMKWIFTLSALALFAACGPLNEGRSGPQLVRQLNPGLFGGDTAPAAPVISPEVANAGPGNVLLVTLRARDLVAPMLRTATNGSRVTWKSDADLAMTFDNGILISTRGLGDDLMGADTAGLQEAIQNGQGTTTRRQSYLDSLDQIVTFDLTCEVSSPGVEETALLTGPAQLTKVVESCQSPRLVFENSYWLSDGKIIKSSQAISASQGFISVEQL